MLPTLSTAPNFLASALIHQSKLLARSLTGAGAGGQLFQRPFSYCVSRLAQNQTRPDTPISFCSGCQHNTRVDVDCPGNGVGLPSPYLLPLQTASANPPSCLRIAGG